ncbi:MAG TPA: ABC transporter permease [Clostridiaceae bacterium]|nr:ABC transporter permease [Clostridiaceae bacterium]
MMKEYILMEKRLIRTLEPVTSILLSFLIGALVVLMIGESPAAAFSVMVRGAFGSMLGFSSTIAKMTTLTMCGLSYAFAFRCGLVNIGAEGQMYMGAFAASFIALKYPGMPRPLLLIFMTIAGIAGGGLWALIPAFFKARWRTNETIVTLMLNYVALKFITYLQFGPWRDPKATGFPKIPGFSQNAILPKFLGIHMGWIIALVLAFLMYIIMNRSKIGYETAVIGESEKTARYAGIDIKGTIMTVLFISGGLCGLAGMIEASAVCNTLSVDLTGGAGYTAIIITWLSSLKAPFIILVSMLFAALVQGASYIQIAFNIPSSIAQMLQGIILFFVLGSELFIKYRFISKRRLEKYIKYEIDGKSDTVDRKIAQKEEA